MIFYLKVTLSYLLLIVYFLVILIGDMGVGKSSCVTRFTRNQFSMETQSTLIVDFDQREILVSFFECFIKF